MNLSWKLLLCLVAVAQLSTAQSRKIEKAYEALWMFDYFKAKEVFEKSVEKEYCASTYGLSLVYGQEKSPFQQIDSAYKFIVYADSAYRFVSEKERIELNGLDINGVSIKQQKVSISEKLFVRVLAENKWERYQQFIDSNLWSPLVDSALILRDNEAYQRANDTNTYQSFSWFTQSFPESKQFDQASVKYDSLFYLDYTKSQTLEVYQQFLFEYPESPYRVQAEIEVFSHGVDAKNPESYYLFILENPQSPYIQQAWENYYAYAVKDGTKEQFVQFAKNHPNSPLTSKAIEGASLADELFFPFSVNGKWGYVNEKGKVRIEPRFEWVDSFTEGKAAVGIDDYTAYINRQGDTLIPPLFDDGDRFVQGVARVELNDQFQLIDYKGDFITQTPYSDLGEPSEGYCYAQKEFFGFVDIQTGEETIPLLYEDAYNFSFGVAVVERNGYFGLINPLGEVLLDFDFDRIEVENHNFFRVRKNNFWGALDGKADTLLSFQYSFIGALKDSLVLIIRSDSSGYAYANLDGDIVLEGDWDIDERTPIYASFQNGLAAFKARGKFGLIDTAGNKIFPALFEAVGTYDSTLTPIKRYGKWGYANANVKLEIKYQYDYAYGFNNGLAKVELNGKTGFINAANQAVIPLEFEEAFRVSPDIFLLKYGEKYGLLSIENDTLIPFAATDYLEVFDDYLVLLHKDQRLIFQLSTKQLVFNQFEGLKPKREELKKE